MNLILFGPPGAGKGTQSNELSKNYNLQKVSTGDLLRNEIEKKTLLGKEIKEAIDKGKLVSDKIINSLIDLLLSEKKFHNRLIFDGYPRNLNQAETLENSLNKFNQKILCVLSLNVDKEIIIKRILGRQICSKCGLIFNEFYYPGNKKEYKCNLKFLEKRPDDNREIIETRYDTYLKETKPILNFYKNKDLLHEVNGMNKISTIYEEICSIIGALKG